MPQSHPRTTARSLRRVAVTATCVALAAGLLGSGTASAARDTPAPFPQHPSGLPAPGPVGTTIDAPAGYQPQQSCAAAPLPGTVRLRNLVLRTYDQGHDGGLVRSCVVGDTSEHKDGRAWDWMVDVRDKRERRAAGDFLAWLTKPGKDGQPGAMARRLGVMYVIYNHQSWSSYSGQWKDYTGYSPHTDHVHISLSWNGARGNVSFWKGRTFPTDHGTCQVFRNAPATAAGKRPRTRPCAEAVVPARSLNRPMLWMGSTGDQVRAAQRLLGVSATGTYTAATRTRVLRYQRRHDLPTTGAVDGATWGSLLPGDARANAPAWTPAQAGDWARDVAGSPRLRGGSAGRGVTALQAALGIGVADRTGYLGRRTRQLLLEFKREHGLGRTGLVSARVWRLLP